jgi:hypothetical protein
MTPAAASEKHEREQWGSKVSGFHIKSFCQSGSGALRASGRVIDGIAAHRGRFPDVGSESSFGGDVSRHEASRASRGGPLTRPSDADPTRGATELVGGAAEGLE